MNYHNITHDDMRNGDGLRVVLWLAGCDHACPGCQNPITWNPQDGLPFDDHAERELYHALEKDYIGGLTLSGGDPLHPMNRAAVHALCRRIKQRFPEKTIWLYTGYTWEELNAPGFLPLGFLGAIDVIVDGPFVLGLKDVTYPWAGSRNQRVIDVQRSMIERRIVPYENSKEGRNARGI